MCQHFLKLDFKEEYEWTCYWAVETKREDLENKTLQPLTTGGGERCKNFHSTTKQLSQHSDRKNRCWLHHFDMFTSLMVFIDKNSSTADFVVNFSNESWEVIIVRQWRGGLSTEYNLQSKTCGFIRASADRWLISIISAMRKGIDLEFNLQTFLLTSDEFKKLWRTGQKEYLSTNP